MKILDVIQKRRSIRKYLAKPVEEEKLARVLEAARLAPSARNAQPLKLIVVRDAVLRERLSGEKKGPPFLKEAPVVIAACGTDCDRVMMCGQHAYTVDAAIAVDHMTLQAVQEGLGTCWICAFDEQNAKSVLGVPAEARIVALMTLGYPAEAPEAKPRKSMDELVSYDKW